MLLVALYKGSVHPPVIRLGSQVMAAGSSNKVRRLPIELVW